MKSWNHKIISLISLGICYSVLLGLLLLTTFIPLRYRLFIGAVILFGVLLVLIFTKKPVFRYILSILIIIVSIFVVNSWSFFGDIALTKDYENIRYSLLSNQVMMKYDKIGYYNIKSDHQDELFIELEDNYHYQEIKEYTSLEDIYNDLLEGSLDAILIDDNSISTLNLLYPTSKRLLDLDNYVLKVEYELQAIDVDVNKEPYIIYLTGIDTYGDVTIRSRTDMNMILVVNPVERKVLSVALPRDTYVPLGCEGGEYDKLTHTGIYGVSCSIKTIENLLDIQINYYLRVNFSGLVQVIDGIGGVEVNSPYPFETDSGYSFEKGLNTVNGKEALAFARERNHLPQGDVDRSINHQELMMAIFKKATSIEEIPNLPNLLHKLQNVIDTNFGDENFSKITADQMDAGEDWLFESIYLKGTGDMQPTYSQGDGYKYYIYWPDEESLTQIRNEIQIFLQVE